MISYSLRFVDEWFTDDGERVGPEWRYSVTCRVCGGLHADGAYYPDIRATPDEPRAKLMGLIAEDVSRAFAAKGCTHVAAIKDTVAKWLDTPGKGSVGGEKTWTVPTLVTP